MPQCCHHTRLHNVNFFHPWCHTDHHALRPCASIDAEATGFPRVQRKKSIVTSFKQIVAWPLKISQPLVTDMGQLPTHTVSTSRQQSRTSALCSLQLQWQWPACDHRQSIRPSDANRKKQRPWDLGKHRARVAYRHLFQLGKLATLELSEHAMQCSRGFGPDHQQGPVLQCVVWINQLISRTLL